MPRKAKVTDGGPLEVTPAVEPEAEEVLIPAPVSARKRFVVLAPFTLDRYEFKAGEEFIPAYNFERDTAELPAGVKGIAFIRTIDRGAKKDPDFVRFILPVQEV